MKRRILLFVMSLGVLLSAQKPTEFTPAECAGYYVIWADAYHRNERVLNQLSYAELVERSTQMTVCATNTPKELAEAQQAYFVLSEAYSHETVIRMYSYLQRHGLVTSFLKEDGSLANR